MNTYKIPRGSMSQGEYYNYVSSIPVIWVGKIEFQTDYNNQTTTIDGTMEGFELITSFTPAPIPQAPISKLEFRNRFTMNEKAAIYTAAKTSVAIQVWLEDLAAASEVNTSHVQTIAGVQALEQAGLIGAGRAVQILGA